MKSIIDNGDAVFDKIISLSIDNFVFYFDSIENYQARKHPKVLRILVYYALIIVLLMFTTALFILSKDPVHPIGTIFGAFLHEIVTSSSIIYTWGSVCYLFILIGKLTMLYLELTKQLPFKFLQTIINPNYRLTPTNHARLLALGHIVYWLLSMSHIISILSIPYCMCLGIFGNFISNCELNLLGIFLTSLGYAISAHQIQILVIGVIGHLFIAIFYLRKKLAEITRSISFSASTNDRDKLLDMFEYQYNEFTKSVGQVSKAINCLIGVIYSITPYIISMTIEMTRVTINNLYDMIRLLFSVAFLIIFIIGTLIMNMACASINNENRPLAKYLYRLIADIGRQQQMPSSLSNRHLLIRISYLKFLLKIDSHISRLNEQYIGFHCFNLFEFTKLGFFEYFSATLSVIILISNLYH